MFTYKAMNRSGQTVRGEIEAASRQEAVALLAEGGKFVDEITAGGDGRLTTNSNLKVCPKKVSRLRLSEKDRVEFVGQLATALRAHLSLTAALQVVGQQNPRSGVKQLTGELASILNSGQPFSHALRQYPRIFDKLHVSMVKVGEAAGQLEQSITQIARMAEQEFETRGKIATAALYPTFVLCLGLISVFIVVTWILPQILATLPTESAVQPAPTRAIMAISAFLKLYGPALLIALTATALILARWKKTVMGRYLWDSVKLRLPVLGAVQRKWAMARFARTLGTLTNGGINILDALHIVRNSLGNEVLARQVDQITRQVRSGVALAAALQQHRNFPPLLLQIVSVGEETGELAAMLLSAAEAFDKDTQLAIKRFMALFPAVLILILALVVGFIVAATLLPIVEIETAMPGL